jgi:holo-[acyl-carrier protein] synthase
MGLGIDIVEISRISLEEKFINFVLSKREQDILNTRLKKKEFIAGRFAAKEAFLKANHMGLGDISLNKIEVLYGDNGQPIIIYDNKTYEEVSISHEREYAVATVIIL